MSSAGIVRTLSCLVNIPSDPLVFLICFAGHTDTQNACPAGDVYLHDGEGELPALPDAAQSRLRFSFTELRAQLEAREDVWPAEQEATEERCCIC